MSKKKNFKCMIFRLTMILIGLYSFLFINVKSKAASNNIWQSVYANEETVESFIYYVKYGNLYIAKNGNTVYAKNSSIDTSIKIKIGYIGYGGVLTNGKDIIYQKRKNIYLWKDIKRKTKLCTLKKKSDILIARYGNDIYFGRYIDYDDFQVYRYNLKNKKTVKTQYHNGYYSNGKYLFVNGQFHEGVSTPLILYNIKTRKTATIAKHGSFGNAAIISGGYVYYSKLNDEKWAWKIVQYNLKTKKKKVISKSFNSMPIWLNKNYCYFLDYEEKSVRIYDIKNKRMLEE